MNEQKVLKWLSEIDDELDAIKRRIEAIKDKVLTRVKNQEPEKQKGKASK